MAMVRSLSPISSFSRADSVDEGTYLDGDLDCNGEVDFGDFLVLSQNFGFTNEEALAAVPEPNSLVGATRWDRLSYQNIAKRDDENGMHLANVSSEEAGLLYALD